MVLAVVWDLDGVLVDSADAHNRSWGVMAEQFGVRYDGESDFKAIFGRHNFDIIRDVWAVSDQSQIDAMTEAKESAFRLEARTLKPLPGVEAIMSALAKAGWVQAIGSSAPAVNVSLLLEVTGLAHYLATITTGDDVSRGKPDPEVFIRAFKSLGVDPSQGVVIEDAPAGVIAGKRAGAAVIGVTTGQKREALAEAGADLVVDSLEEIAVGTLERLVQGRDRA